MNSLTGRGCECSRLLSANGSWKLKRKVVNESELLHTMPAHTHTHTSNFQHVFKSTNKGPLEHTPRQNSSPIHQYHYPSPLVLQ